VDEDTLLWQTLFQQQNHSEYLILSSSTTLAISSPLILVDGSSYLFRAYHVPYLQALRTSKGQPTGAITGVLNMIRACKKTTLLAM